MLGQIASHCRSDCVDDGQVARFRPWNASVLCQPGDRWLMEDVTVPFPFVTLCEIRLGGNTKMLLAHWVWKGVEPNLDLYLCRFR